MPKFSRKSMSNDGEPKTAAEKRAMKDLTSEVNNDFKRIVLPTLGVLGFLMVVIIYFGTRAA